MEEIDLMDLLAYFCKKVWIVITLMLVFIIGVIVYINFILTPLYDSHTTLVLARVSGETITQNDISLNKNLISTYREIIKSRLILDKVNETLDLDLSYNALKQMVSVASVNDTELIDIKVSYTSPELAQSIAREIANTFKKEIINIYKLENVSIVDEATFDDNPSNISPTKQSILAGMAGLILGCGIIFVMFIFDDTIKQKRDVVEKVKLSVLGELPKLSDKNIKNEIQVIKDPKSVFSETIRNIRSNVKFLMTDKKLKTILITSALASEGKSIFAANLAISLAQAGESVLLVDCDLRKGRLHSIFAGVPSPGYTDLVMYHDTNTDFQTLIKSFINKTKIKNLDLLYRGGKCATTSELLESYVNKEIIANLKKMYSVVIFDSAPINSHLTDSLILSNLVDGVLIVATKKYTPMHLLKETKEQLDNANAKILGVILNKDERSSDEKYYGYY